MYHIDDYSVWSKGGKDRGSQGRGPYSGTVERVLSFFEDAFSLLSLVRAVMHADLVALGDLACGGSLAWLQDGCAG